MADTIAWVTIVIADTIVPRETIVTADTHRFIPTRSHRLDGQSCLDD
jgi:hypothetical protein